MFLFCGVMEFCVFLEDASCVTYGCSQLTGLTSCFSHPVTVIPKLFPHTPYLQFFTDNHKATIYYKQNTLFIINSTSLGLPTYIFVHFEA